MGKGTAGAGSAQQPVRTAAAARALVTPLSTQAQLKAAVTGPRAGVGPTWVAGLQAVGAASGSYVATGVGGTPGGHVGANVPRS